MSRRCYAAGLIAVTEVRRRHRDTYLDAGYSIVEALLWLGIYLAINLQLSSMNLFGQWWGRPQDAAVFSKLFYWATWVLIWCLPPAVLARGLRQKDRFVIAVGAAAGILTLVTNKPYLGWQRHSWDPMLLGALLMAAGISMALARRRTGRNSPRLHRAAPLGAGQILDERRRRRIRPRIGERTNAEPADSQFRLPFRRRRFGRRRRQLRFLKPPVKSSPTPTG